MDPHKRTAQISEEAFVEFTKESKQENMVIRTKGAELLNNGWLVVMGKAGRTYYSPNTIVLISD